MWSTATASLFAPSGVTTSPSSQSPPYCRLVVRTERSQRLPSAEAIGCLRLTEVDAHTRAVTDNRMPLTNPPIANKPDGVTRAFTCIDALPAPAAISAVCGFDKIVLFNLAMVVPVGS